MGRSELSGQAQFRKYDREIRFYTLYFCEQTAICRPQPTSGDQNTVKTTRPANFLPNAFVPLCKAIIVPYMTHPIISLRFRVTAQSVT